MSDELETFSVPFQKGTPFKSRPRSEKVRTVVIHESASPTLKSADATLRRNGYGVHWAVDLDGTLWSFVDPKLCTGHAAGLNDGGVGIETVSAYYPPSSAKKGTDPGNYITAVWAHKGKYLLPPREQCEVVWKIVKHMCMTFDLPLVFPGVLKKSSGEFFYWGRADTVKQPGIQAHHRTAHADGLFQEHYCMSRHRGLDKDEAYTETVRLASLGKRETPMPFDDDHPSVA